VIVYGLVTLLSYLIGAIPFGYVLVKLLRGVDLREVGSGNLGATNAGRLLGAKWFAVVFLFDFLKGFVPAFVFGRLAREHLGAPELIGLLYGFAAMSGHIWPVYLKFRGGKGVATAAGTVTGIAPLATGIAAVVFIGVFVIWRIVSLASISAAVALPIAHGALSGKDAFGPTLLALTAMALIIVLKHRSNIRRLCRGEEPRAVRLKEKEDA
jgi:acyl phosphate:glycerol-3-phosphate acyltransferase